MKKMVVVGLVGLALGLVMPGVFAQAPQAEVQKWEQFCESVNPKNKPWSKARAEINARLSAHGQEGYQLFMAAPAWGGQLYCYRRPSR